MTKKIALIGTHSGGKTTSAHTLMGEIKARKHTAEFVSESAREALAIGFKLDAGATQDAQEWILHNQICNELQAELYNPDFIITDRSVFDGLAYIMVNSGDIEYLRYIDDQINSYIIRHPYDYMLYFPPLSDKPQNDGVRAINIDYQLKVHHAFTDLLRNGYIMADIVQSLDKNARRSEAVDMILRRFEL